MRHRPSQGGHLVRRILLLTAIVVVGAVVWVMLGEPETVTAAESRGRDDSERHDEELSQAVRTAVRGVLLKTEAARRGLTREELLAAEAKARPSGLSAEEVEAALLEELQVASRVEVEAAFAELVDGEGR